MMLSNIRPFGEWYEFFIGSHVPVQCDAMQGIFGLHRDHILQHSLSYYKMFFCQVNSHHNHEVGHFLERAWSSIFYPFPDYCVYCIDRDKVGFITDETIHYLKSHITPSLYNM